MKKILSILLSALLIVSATTLFACNNNGQNDNNPPKDEGFFSKSTIDTTTYYGSQTLPIISLDTDDQEIKDKETYVDCSVDISNADSKYCFENASAGIKLRGNSTLKMPKKAYKLKFESKQNIFGNGKAKTWTLLANYIDRSLIRNYIALSLGNIFEEIEHTSSIVNVDLYLNGEYQGVYSVCEQVEVKTNRLEIDDDLDDVDTGYLIELDTRITKEKDATLNENYFVFDYNNAYKGYTNNYSIKSPDTEDERYSSDFCDYIKTSLSNSFTAITSNNYSNVCNYVDVDSFACCYIIHELMKINDIGYSSFYLYKKKGDNKIYCGPLWDFDLSSGNNLPSNNISLQSLYAKKNNAWYNGLLNYSKFRNLVAQKLSDYQNEIITTISNCFALCESRKTNFDNNFVKWDVLGKEDEMTELGENYHFIPHDLAMITSWQGHIDYLKDWLERSLKYMNNSYQLN